MENYTKKLEKEVSSIVGVQYDWSPLESFRIGFKEGAIWQRNNMWISINDRDNVIPNDKDVLIRMSNGEVRRCNEDWESEFALDGTITHWMPIPSIFGK